MKKTHELEVWGTQVRVVKIGGNICADAIPLLGKTGIRGRNFF